MFPVYRRLFVVLSLYLFMPIALPSGAAIVDPKLQAAMQSAAPTTRLTAIVTYNARPTAVDVAALATIGVQYGRTFKQLPMIAVWATPAQLKQIATLSTVRSLYADQKLKWENHEATALVGALQQRTMPGFGYTGKGITVAVVDSGIDATHPDLLSGTKVKLNAKVVINGPEVDSALTGIIPATYAEGLPDSDLDCGHGTHCAGIIAGTGARSNGQYAGAAPDAQLVGVSTGESITVLWALAGFDYVMQHAADAGIRIVSNSWGTSGKFDPEDPVNVASKMLHDGDTSVGRPPLVVFFAAGNSGPGSDTLNPYSVAPWVIGVAASDKKAHLAGFSSRGLKDDPLYHPTITAPGVSIVSCRATGSVLGAVSGDITDDQNLPPDLIPYYAHLSGTSMSTPCMAGCAAVLLQAVPTLKPDDVKNIFSATATRMPGFEQFQVGAGHANVLAAIDMAKNKHVYGDVLNQTFTAKFAGYTASERWDDSWDPTLPPPTHHYNIAANGVQSDVFITWDNPANTFNLAVTDPSGTQTSTGSNLLAAAEGQQNALSFSFPAAGDWFTTMYGLKGQSTGTTGAGVPDVIHASVLNYYGTFSGMNDVDGTTYAAYIRRAIALRLMDSYPDGGFHPTTPMSRYMMAKFLASNCLVRQNRITDNPFTDISGSIVPYVQAVTAAGGPLRDMFSQYGPIMTGTSATTFSASSKFARADLAVWLVKAMGLEPDAQANITTTTTFTDDAQIPAYARGYVVVANNIGLLQGYVNAGTVPGAPPTYSWKPSSTVYRGEMAMAACRWYDLFNQ